MSKRARLAKKERRASAHHWAMAAQAHYELYPDDFDCYDEGPDQCWRCGGDGYIDGVEMAEYDPLWYDATAFYKCNCCGGSGNADDCTYW